jgi:hypothetical protein
MAGVVRFTKMIVSNQNGYSENEWADDDQSDGGVQVTVMSPRT